MLVTQGHPTLRNSDRFHMDKGKCLLLGIHNHSRLFNISSRVFWANSGLGLASVPGFWKVFHEGNVTVHRTEISSFGDDNIVNLKNQSRLETDFVILCTGWTHNLAPFSEELRTQFNLPSNADFGFKWESLEAQAEENISEQLPFLAKSPKLRSVGTERRPWRLYRCLVSPNMAAQGDRSIFFPGQIHSPFTPIMAEMQALWGLAYMLGLIRLPEQETMEEEIARWNVWTRKRYLEQGKKHSYSIYGFLAVSSGTSLLLTQLKEDI